MFYSIFLVICFILSKENNSRQYGYDIALAENTVVQRSEFLFLFCRISPSNLIFNEYHLH